MLGQLGQRNGQLAVPTDWRCRARLRLVGDRRWVPLGQTMVWSPLKRITTQLLLVTAVSQSLPTACLPPASCAMPEGAANSHAGHGVIRKEFVSDIVGGVWVMLAPSISSVSHTLPRSGGCK